MFRATHFGGNKLDENEGGSDTRSGTPALTETLGEGFRSEQSTGRGVCRHLEGIVPFVTSGWSVSAVIVPRRLRTITRILFLLQKRNKNSGQYLTHPHFLLTLFSAFDPCRVFPRMELANL